MCGEQDQCMEMMPPECGGWGPMHTEMIPPPPTTTGYGCPYDDMMPPYAMPGMCANHMYMMHPPAMKLVAI